MLLIAHRGLVNGPNAKLENTPHAIESARSLGYDVEIDVRYINNEWWLGHDSHQYQVTWEWLQDVDRKDYLDQHHAWIHAKNIDALYELMKRHWQGHVFWHQNDDVVVTTTKFLWTYPGKQLTSLSICVMPEWNMPTLDKLQMLNCYGICSDFVETIRHKLINI